MPVFAPRPRVDGLPLRHTLESLADLGFGNAASVRAATPGRGDRGGSAGAYGRTLRQALEEAGPIFRLFGIYLASRVDLLPLADCMELGRLTDHSPPMPADVFRARLPGSCVVEPEPAESRTLYQMHRGCLADGRRVQIRVARPGLQAWLDAAETFFDACSSPTGYNAAAQDFRQSLSRRLDFQCLLEGLQTLQRDALRIDCLASAKVLKEFSGPGALVLEFPGEPAHADQLGKPRDAAHGVCSAWLAEALEGRAFAADAGLENIRFLGRRVCFVTDEFGALTKDSQQALWEYLNAAASDDPDTCASRLAGEMEAGRRCRGEKALAQGMRQIVPFRDGAWETGSGQSLAEHLFLHWKLATECGYRPRPHLLAFWRGLFLIARTAYRLEPASDVLSVTLHEMRTTRLLDHMQEFLDLNRAGGRFDEYSALALGLPKRMNDVLEQASSGRIGVRVSTSDHAPEARPLLLGALLMVFAGIAAYARILAPVLAHSAWLERIGFLILLLLGAAMIRLAVRTS